MTALITSALSVLAIMLELYVKYKNAKAKEKPSEVLEQSRNDIATGGVAAVNGRVDKLLSDGSLPAKADSDADSATGQHSEEDTAERLHKILDS